MPPLKVAVVDDEPVAVRRLARLIRDCSDVVLVGTAVNAADATALVGERQPDIVLLDIEMPGIHGLELARRLRAATHPPEIIFVTAFSRFALAAFEVAAADYLLKPVEPARLTEALERARSRQSANSTAERLADLELLVRKLQTEEQDRALLEEPLWLATAGGRERILVREIIWIGAERDYVRVHTGRGAYFIRARVGDLAARLGGHGLVQIHRSSIVRSEAVRRIETLGDRRHRLVLQDGTALVASRRFAQAVQQMIASAAFSG